MSQQLISRNPELQKLQSEGIEVNVHGGLIYVHHVPYLNAKQEVCGGTLAFTYSQNGDILDPPSDHTAHWLNDKPYTESSEEVPSLINGAQDGWNGHATAFLLSLYPDSLPNRKYPDFYTKVRTYYNTIAGHAINKNPEAAAKVKSPVIQASDASVFEYEDLNSSRAGINGLSQKLEDKKVAIIGLGGSGSYLLDFIAKTPVSEIHLYDDDIFSTHNAFRAPGAPTFQELERGIRKSEHFAGVYSKMRRGIIPHSYKIDDATISEIYEMDMVFLCVDSVQTRNFISRNLIEHNIPFIDSGLGLTIKKDGLAGQVRVTTYDGVHEDHIADSFGADDIKEDLYASNIQVAEINCLSAIMMVIRWKRLLGFYSNEKGFSLEEVYNISMNKIFSRYEGQYSGTNVC